MLAVVLLGGIACAQEAPGGDQVFSSDLVAWSFMQQPQSPEQEPSRQQPTPDPNPETQPRKTRRRRNRHRRDKRKARRRVKRKYRKLSPERSAKKRTVSC